MDDNIKSRIRFRISFDIIWDCCWFDQILIVEELRVEEEALVLVDEVVVCRIVKNDEHEIANNIEINITYRQSLFVYLKKFKKK